VTKRRVISQHSLLQSILSTSRFFLQVFNIAAPGYAADIQTLFCYTLYYLYQCRLQREKRRNWAKNCRNNPFFIMLGFLVPCWSTVTYGVCTKWRRFNMKMKTENTPGWYATESCLESLHLSHDESVAVVRLIFFTKRWKMYETDTSIKISHWWLYFQTLQVIRYSTLK
jgi:hypothetical protein